MEEALGLSADTHLWNLQKEACSRQGLGEATQGERSVTRHDHSLSENQGALEATKKRYPHCQRNPSDGRLVRRRRLRQPRTSVCVNEKVQTPEFNERHHASRCDLVTRQNCEAEWRHRSGADQQIRRNLTPETE